MQYNIKRDNKKHLAVALGVILALAPCAVIVDNLEPVPVYADFGELSGISDYLQYGFGEGAVGSAGESSAWGLDGYPAYFAALWMADLILNNPLQTGGGLNFSNAVAITGLYSVGGQVRRGFISVADNVTTGADSYILAESPDFNIRLTCSPYNGHGGLSGTCTVGNSSSGSNLQTRFNFSNSDGGRIEYDFNFVDGNSFFNDYTYKASGSHYSFHYSVSLNNYIPSLSSGQSISRYFSSDPYALMGNGIRPYLPMYEGHDFNDYVINVLNPYYVNLFPDIQQYVFAPYSPEFPDPSDAYPGIPKDWTIKNPQLPTSPQIGFNAYNVDTSDYDVSSTLTEYTDGFGFWWWLTGKCLDFTHTKGIVIVAIILGLVGFILWRLGGSL